MCAYTHTGGLHVQRWITAESIEPSYSSEEIAEVLFFAELIGTLAVLGFATLRNDDRLGKHVFNAYQKRKRGEV